MLSSTYEASPATLPWGFLSLFCVLGLLVIVFAALYCIICGLFCLSALTKEYSMLTKGVLRWVIRGLMVLYPLLWILEGLSWVRCVLSFFANIAYYRLLRSFPYVRIVSVEAVASGLLFVADSVSWYTYFDSAENHQYPSWAIASFFALGCWFAPLLLFISLSVDDERFPTSSKRDRKNNSSFLFLRRS